MGKGSTNHDVIYKGEMGKGNMNHDVIYKG